ncbi:hypothetical protein [Pseudorhodobacter sp.]|uniref:hypothetical protein n=1 Tax=Pseudorhodobacter sp. TaxID=1934400 RepID=UPI0026480F77|nr:hypothetical protein [Pseudorhodobacter sp.]
MPVNDTLGQELPERNDLDTSAGKAIGPAQGGFRIPGEMIVDVALNPEIAARHLVSLLPGPANNHALLAGNSADLSVKLLQDWQGPPLSIRPETGLKFLIEIFGPGSAVHDILTMVAP